MNIFCQSVQNLQVPDSTDATSIKTFLIKSGFLPSFTEKKKGDVSCKLMGGEMGVISYGWCGWNSHNSRSHPKSQRCDKKFLDASYKIITCILSKLFCYIEAY